MGSVFVAKYASVAMSKNKPNEIGERGVIIFVSSIQADEGPAGMVAYAMTKGGINGMVMPMARDLGRFGIRVAALQPGVFETAMSDLIPDEYMKLTKKNTPQSRIGKAKEFAHMVGAMVENSYINGVALKLDGAQIVANL